MFRRLKLRNYRSIEEGDVTLGPFGVLVGPNGSGKSNLADAFVFARDLAVDASMAVSSRGGISSVRRWSKSRPFDIQLEFRLAESEAQQDTDYLEHTLTIGIGADGEWHF
jgi:type I restriction enzyme M protein